MGVISAFSVVMTKLMTQWRRFHKDPRINRPTFIAPTPCRDGRRGFPLNQTARRKKASDVCRALEKASEKARAGEITEIQVRKLLDDILESVGQRSVQSESVRSFFTTWLSSKQLPLQKRLTTHYTKVLERFLEGLGDRADKSLANVSHVISQLFVMHRLKADGNRHWYASLELKAIKSAFSSARRQGLILHNPG